MDDQNFDDFVKGRLDGYEDPSFDPSALAGFRDKLAFYRPAPWYQVPAAQYMMAASLTLFTVVNLYLFWPSKVETVNTSSSHKNSNQTIIDSLTVVIEQLNERAQTSARVNDSLLTHLYAQPVISQVTPPARISRNGLYLGATDEIPADLYHALMVKRMLVTDKGEAYLIAPEKSSHAFGNSDLALTDVGENYPWPVAGLSDVEVKGRKETPSVIIPQKQRAISSKMRNELEKHYSKGIGIYLAPHADLIKNVFSAGDGAITPRLGVTADWVLSPTLSVETGVDYSTTSVSIERNFQDVYTPGPDASLGVVERVQIRNSLLSAPLAVKYRQWVSEKSQAFVKIGYTPYLSFKQEYQFGYDFDRGPGPNQMPSPNPGYNPDHHHVNSIAQTIDRDYYGSTGTVSLGLTRLIKDKNKLEASLFYEKSIGTVGQEQLAMQLFGLRTAYWFNLR